jgi:methionyl-tRNA formyltransferase
VIRTAFLGTPDSAVPTLRALSAETDVQVVITQPDRPKGRSGTPVPPPVKTEAEGRGLAVAQPRDRSELLAALESAGRIDVAVVVAYGRILPAEALSLPGTGTLNAHFSLLPRWRGAAPVSRALMSGDTMTGVTIIQLDEGLDSGPVLTAQAVDIAPDDDLGTLTERLAHLAARLVVTVLPEYVDGRIVPVTQSEDGLTYASKLTPADRRIGPGMSATELVNRVRALSPRPGATLAVDGVDHKVLKARAATSDVPAGRWSGESGAPVIGVADGAVELVLVQAPGRRVVAGEDWLRGHPVARGEIG